MENLLKDGDYDLEHRVRVRMAKAIFRMALATLNKDAPLIKLLCLQEKLASGKHEDQLRRTQPLEGWVDLAKVAQGLIALYLGLKPNEQLAEPFDVLFVFAVDPFVDVLHANYSGARHHFSYMQDKIEEKIKWEK